MTLTLLEELEDYAYENGIDLLSGTSLSTRKGSCMVMEEQSVIYLNEMRIKDAPDRTCVLAEEIGHIQTGTLLTCETYLRPENARCLKRKNERRAKQWSIRRLLPHIRIQKALDSGCRNDYELAEELQVSESFLQTAVNYYIGKGIVFTAPYEEA